MTPKPWHIEDKPSPATADVGRDDRKGYIAGVRTQGKYYVERVVGETVYRQPRGSRLGSQYHVNGRCDARAR